MTANLKLTDEMRELVYEELLNRLMELRTQGIIGPEVKTDMLITWLATKLRYERGRDE